MLTSRSGQMERAATLIDEARIGRAGTLGIVGDPGTGKTALLDAVVEECRDVTVLRAAGAAGELGLGYGALGILLRPLIPAVDRLSPRLQQALRSAIGLTDTSSDPLTVGTALVELVGAVSAARTVVVVVDDVQWVDADTRRALAFLLRRMGGQPVAVLLAARAAADLPDEARDPIHLGQLTGAESQELLRSRAGDLDDGVAALIAARSGGNALVLVEVLAELTPDQRRGRSPLGELAPLPERVARAFQDRMDRLDVAARAALLVTVCEGRGRSRVVQELCGGEAVQSLLDAGLVRREGPLLQLRHPLLGAAVLERASMQEQRAVHAQLASVIQGGEPDRAAWHQAWSVVGPDPARAAAVAEFGRKQRLHGAPLAAVHALERAAELTGDARGQADLYVEAALVALEGGRTVSSLELVKHAIATGEQSPGEPIVLGRLARLHGRHAEAVELLARAALLAPADRVGPIHVEQFWCALDGQQHDLVVEAAARVGADALVEPPVLAAVQALAGYDISQAGVPAEGLSALTAVACDPPPDASVELVQVVAHAANRCGDQALAESLHLRASRLLSNRGDVLGAAHETSFAGFLAFLQGRWVTAEARCLQTRQLVDEAGAPVLISDVVQVQSEIAAAQGREDACRTMCGQLHRLAQVCEDPHISVLADRHEALLEIGLQRWDRARALLERAVDTLTRSQRWHPYVSPAVDLVEVLLRLQEPERAAATAETFLARIGPGSPPMGRARAAKIRALLAPPEEADALFEESAQLDQQVGLAFPLARTWLLHAERLRREHRTVHAAALLTRALTAFDRLGAAPWIARTKAELAACGRPRGRPSAVPLHAVLTPQELQIAVLVAEGLRNREISSTLFLSLRTVEFHLSSVYRKLGVSGRTQLVGRMTSK